MGHWQRNDNSINEEKGNISAINYLALNPEYFDLLKVNQTSERNYNALLLYGWIKSVQRNEMKNKGTHCQRNPNMCRFLLFVYT